jgi:hypothetical protein
MSPTSAAATAAATATASAGPPTAASTPAATTATTAADNNNSDLLTADGVLAIEQMERGETDVGHFLFAENEALIGQRIVGLGDTGSGHRGCRCAPRQRNTQSGTHSRQGGGFSPACRRRSFLDHSRILQSFL